MKTTLSIVLLLASTMLIHAQNSSHKKVTFTTMSSKLVKLGKSDKINDLVPKQETSKEKRQEIKRNKSVPDNFKGRRSQSKAFHFQKEHQGPDPVRQDRNNPNRQVEPFVNVNGIGDFGSPSDPSGDVSDKYYVQMVNATSIGVFNLQGQLIKEFAANTLWNQFQQSSAGDPIVLYDEYHDRWIITEFANPSNILIAVSDNGNPLGAYSAYNFSTPHFPDYPKYGLSPDILTLTTNEINGGELHQYFIDLNDLYSGVEGADLQRIEIVGNTETRGGFYVTTPVDWNGKNLPFDNRPIVITLNDSSWEGGPDKDQIEVYTFDIDFENAGNTKVTQTSVPIAPFDPYPCSKFGFGFACIPQRGGSGLDGVPEVIMNLPHLRNFLSHESMVFSFITDATDGLNISGIRWVEFRRKNAEDNWHLFQEGTYAPADGLDRFMPSVAINAKGDIGLAYNVSSDDMFVGARFTGRTVYDPPGEMTVEETIIVDGLSTISSNERFGDYSHMSVSPAEDQSFWWTGEYAGNGSSVTQSRIVAFQIQKDNYDLALRSLKTPSTSSDLSNDEKIEVSVINSGIESISEYEVQLYMNNELVETVIKKESIEPDSQILITFASPVDMSTIGTYDIKAFVFSALDQNETNNTVELQLKHIYITDALLKANLEQGTCNGSAKAYLTIINNGERIIDSIGIVLEVNGQIQDTLSIIGSIGYDEKIEAEYEVYDLNVGTNSVDLRIHRINEDLEDDNLENNLTSLSNSTLPPDEFITLQLFPDLYPEENSWELYYEGNGDLVASGDFVGVEDTYNLDICASKDSCYRFILNDAFGDGICCSYGGGSFNIFSSSGALLASNNGSFGDIAIETFCAAGPGCSLQTEINITGVSSNQASDGIIMIETIGGLEPFSYSINGGLTFQDLPVFKGLNPGSYEVVITDGSGLCELYDRVTVGIASSIVDLSKHQVQVSIAPNPSDGVFQIEVLNAFDLPAQLKVEILNLDGKVLQHKIINKYDEKYIGTFSLYEYPSSMYLVRISHPKLQYLGKIFRR